MSFLTFSADSKYDPLADDLRINVSSGILTLRDGTSGGVPAADPTYGLPNQIYSITERVSGVEGYTLQRFMNEFPRYSRVSRNLVSVGAQLMGPFSAEYDTVVDQMAQTIDSLTMKFYPMFEQGTVTEYDFADANDLNDSPPVSGRLGDQWFDLPITKDADQFWLAPPTRFETTTAEISGLTLLNWTAVTSSGINTLLDTATTVPVHNRLWFFVSGASNFRYYMTDEVPAAFAHVMVYGRWANDNLRPSTPVRREQIFLDRNGFFRTENAYSSIDRIEVLGLPSGTQCKLETFNNNARFTADNLVRFQLPVRDTPIDFIFWHLGNGSTNFNQIVQTETAKPVNTSADEAYLVRTYLNTDTIFDQNVEFNYVDVWQLQSRDGTALSGIIDIASVPSARYLLALDNQSNCWIFDTFMPAFNMAGNSEVRESPVRIEQNWPRNNLQTLSAYSLDLTPILSSFSTAIGIERWKWSVNYDGTDYWIDTDGTFYPFNHASGWISNTSRQPEEITVAISGAGQYTFSLDVVDDTGERYRTFAAHRKIPKRAINQVPINGLTTAPSGLDFDYNGRPWVMISGSAIRLVMRTDIGYWSVDERVLLTREPYDEVRKF